ncbi:hypothetical protein EMCRGX_G007723 [Ephydatia muelleri]
MTDRDVQNKCTEGTEHSPVTMQPCNKTESQQIIAEDPWPSFENVNSSFCSRDYYFTLSTAMTFFCCVTGGFLSSMLTIAAMLVSLSAKKYSLNGDKECAEKKSRISLLLNSLAILLTIIVDIILIDVSFIVTHGSEDK